MGRVELTCPGCSKQLGMSDEHLGKTVRCPSCKTMFSSTVDTSVRDAAPGRASQPQAPRSVPRARLAAGQQQPEPTESSKTKRPQPRKTRPSRNPQRATMGEENYDADDTGDSGDTGDLWFADEELIEDYDDPYASPPPARGRSRRRKSGGPARLSPVLMFLGLGLLVVGTLGTIGYFAFQLIPGLGGNVVDMAYVPANTEAFLYVKVSGIAESQIVKSFQAKNPLFRPDGLGNINPSDIDSLLVAMYPDASAKTELPGPFAMSPFGSGEAQGVLMIARFNRSIENSDIKLQQSSEYNGVTLYSDSTGQVCWMPDSTTAVFGNEHSIKEAVDRNGEEFRFKQFDFADASGDLVLVGVSNRASASLSEANPESGNAPFPLPGFDSITRLGDSLSKNATGGCLAVKFSSRIDVTAQVLCRDESSAIQIHKEIDAAISNGKSQIAMMKSNPMVQGMTGQLETVLNSLITGRKGQTLTMSVTLEQSLVDQIPVPRG